MDSQSTRLCLCGCGTPIAAFDTRGRARLYARHHNGTQGHPRPTKVCAVCGTVFEMPRDYGYQLWELRRTCGQACKRRWQSTPAEERFFEKVLCDRATRCWVWTASVNAVSGYGQFTAGPGQQGHTAHRWAYEHLRGPVPAGLHLDHLCRNTRCVNPSHLEAVTPRENNRRSNSVAAVNARKTRCVHGHPYTPETTYRRPNGGRECLICIKARRRLAVKGTMDHAAAGRKGAAVRWGRQ